MHFKQTIQASEGETISVLIDEQDKLGFGLVLAKIKHSRAHHHRMTTETYVLLQGKLKIYFDAERSEIHELTTPGDSLTIPRNVRHWATCDGNSAAHVLVTSIPPWSKGDHIIG